MAVMGYRASGRWSEAAKVLPGDSSVAVVPPASRTGTKLEAATAFPGMVAHPGRSGGCRSRVQIPDHGSA